MDAINLNPGISTGKVLNVKNILTTTAIVLLVLFLMSMIFQSALTIKDNSGNVTGSANFNFTPKWKK